MYKCTKLYNISRQVKVVKDQPTEQQTDMAENCILAQLQHKI